MPNHEYVTVAAQLIIEVDGHTFRFEQTVSTAGGRYHGDMPPEAFANSVLEAGICEAGRLAVSRIGQRADVALGRLYPVSPGATAKISTKDGQ
jgi:hypothetical protein